MHVRMNVNVRCVVSSSLRMLAGLQRMVGMLRGDPSDQWEDVQGAAALKACHTECFALSVALPGRMFPPDAPPRASG